MILHRMGGEAGEAPGDPELLRRKEEFKGIILFGWNCKDFNFFFLYFKVKKHFLAMSILYVYNQKNNLICFKLFFHIYLEILILLWYSLEKKNNMNNVLLEVKHLYYERAITTEGCFLFLSYSVLLKVLSEC